MNNAEINSFQINHLIKRQLRKESNLSLIERKQNGTFLTNQVRVIDNIIDIVDVNSDLLRKKILEPSVGYGIILIRLLERISQSFEINEIKQFIENNLFFVDIDAKMIETTEQNISEWFLATFKEKYKGKFNSYCFDFTKKKQETNLFDLLEPNDYPLKEHISSFDYILGNPPYVTLYGRRDKKQNEEQRIFYLTNYKQFPGNLKNGKINYVMLFLEHGLDLLKQAGKLSFIIDLSFFETAYKFTRKYLLETTKILSIEYNIKEFDVASGQIIIKLKKEKPKNNKTQIKNSKNGNLVEVEQQNWYNPNDEFKFRFFSDEKAKNILTKIEECENKTLKELYPKKNLRTCVMLLNMEDKFVFKEPDLNKSLKVYSYYQGAKGLSEKYGELNNGNYFYYDKRLQNKINDELKLELEKQGIKNKKRLGLGETEIYDNPKIFIRQSAKELIATYTEKPGAANNSLYVFSLRNNNEKSKKVLKFICGLINSELFTFWAQKMNVIRYAKGKQPQIKTSDLYSLPVLQDVGLQNKIGDLVTKIYKEKDNQNYINEIDSLIYNYYKISGDEISFIKAEIKDY